MFKKGDLVSFIRRVGIDRIPWQELFPGDLGIVVGKGLSQSHMRVSWLKTGKIHSMYLLEIKKVSK